MTLKCTGKMRSKGVVVLAVTDHKCGIQTDSSKKGQFGMEIAESSKGNPIAHYLGHTYRHERVNTMKGVTFWRCRNFQKLKCPGRMRSKDGVVLAVLDHQCEILKEKTESSNKLSNTVSSVERDPNDIKSATLRDDSGEKCADATYENFEAVQDVIVKVEPDDSRISEEESSGNATQLPVTIESEIIDIQLEPEHPNSKTSDNSVAAKPPQIISKSGQLYPPDSSVNIDLPAHDSTGQKSDSQIIGQESESPRQIVDQKGQEWLKCEACQNYSTTEKFGQHQCLKKRTYQCGFCDRFYSGSEALKRHIRLHTGEKPYKCDVCDKTFSTKQPLENHKRIHTGERPFKCDLCDKSYRSRGDLINHGVFHREEKNFVCSVCNKAFFSKNILKYHTYTHTRPFECDICQKRFSTNDILKNHRYLHSDEPKPFACNVCTLSFGRQYALTVHMRLHTGEKPYT